MKAFLSHSSKDKGYVMEVASLLRPGSFELDCDTFDQGLLNTQAFERALLRVDIFVLFLSQDALNSGYVRFETLLANELFARGSIERILIVCLDDASFEKASDSLRYHNMVRKAGNSASTARLVVSVGLTALRRSQTYSHPFLNREAEIKELQDQIFDHSRPPLKAIFISGNQGAGRHTLSRKIYSDQYSHVVQPFLEIEVGQYDGLDEIHRKLIAKIRPSTKPREISTIAAAFSIANANEKARQISELINGVLPSREAIIINDTGGMITDDGKFHNYVDDILDGLESNPHPPLIIISLRMIRWKNRRSQKDVAYCGVTSLSHDVSRRLVMALTKSVEITASIEQIDRLTEMGDNHCYNYYRMIDDIKNRSLSVFLSTANEFVDWKHKRSSDYLKRLVFSADAKMIVATLNLIPQADFETLSQATEIEDEALGQSLDKLISDHIVEFAADLYRIAPAVRLAVERDREFALPDDFRNRALVVISERLAVRLEEGTAALQLLDAAILAQIETASTLTAFAQALVLPSHYVWLAQRSYDRQNFPESMRLARVALESKQRLSRNGVIAACRFLCLGAARTGDESSFDEGIKTLKQTSDDKWARSNLEFLRGFNERLKGNLPLADNHYREALRYSEDNFSAARELAAVCAARNDLEDAEKFSRVAQRNAPDNPFVLDVLISVLIRKYGRQARYSDEISVLFDALARVGDEGGRSFYATRKAEFEHLWGDNREALRLIDAAVKATPRIFDVRRIRAQILLKQGDTREAWKEIGKLKEIVDAHASSERRTNYRLYVDVLSEDMVQTAEYEDAKRLYIDNPTFTVPERSMRIKEIEIAQAYARRS